MIWAVLLAAAAPSASMETEAQRFIGEQYERVGRSNPTNDSSLSKAARVLAQQALDSSAADAAEVSNLTAVVSEAGATDPTPRALVLRGSPRGEPLKALLKRTDFTHEGATHFGVGAIEDAAHDRSAIVVLLADRKAELAPFPHRFPKRGASQRLCATLASHLRSADVYVTRPKGDVDHVPGARDQDRWCAKIDFPSDGRHTVELLARGERGPEVAALFFVDVGAQAASGRRVVEAEPTEPAEVRARVLDRINKLRAGYKLGALKPDPMLDAVAQAYARRMATEQFFAHVAPDGSDVRKRLREADYPYSTAGENLGLASGPLAAHFGIEHSPGHRKNLLEPAYTVAGIGASKRADGQLVLVEVLAAPIEAVDLDADPIEQAYAALNSARKSKGLKALTRAEGLEQLLTSHAKKALELDSPKATLEGKRLHDRVFELRDDLGSATVDFFVADNPALITDSKNLGDPKASLVGVGLTRGDSPTFGRDKYWVVVVYGTLR
ncbi:MAG: CAP domain-containing protein [Myxococcaceae bacterium]|nr:CAP domain-containing protein [Myxococcaceae bacterium]